MSDDGADERTGHEAAEGRSKPASGGSGQERPAAEAPPCGKADEEAEQERTVEFEEIPAPGVPIDREELRRIKSDAARLQSTFEEKEDSDG